MILLLLLLTDPAQLASPAGPGSMGASLTVHERDLYLSWIEADTLRLARHDGTAWSTVRTVAGPEKLLANWADFPKLLVLDSWMLIAWPERFETGHGYGFRFARSRDRGRTWTEPLWLHGDRGGEEYGFVSLAEGAAGKAGAVWLDGRDMRGDGMQLRYRQIGPDALGPEQILDGRTCECCATDLVITDKGPLAVYRDRSMHEVRDIAFAGEDRPPEIPFADGWVMPGCPVNGPALDRRDGLTAFAWFTGAGPTRLGVTVSRDDGHRFLEPMRFSETAIGRVDCAITGPDRIAVSWIDYADGGQVVMLAHFGVEEIGVALKGAPVRIGKTPDGRPAGFPRLVLWRDRLVIAYQGEGLGIALKSLPLVQ